MLGISRGIGESVEDVKKRRLAPYRRRLSRGGGRGNKMIAALAIPASYCFHIGKGAGLRLLSPTVTFLALT